MTNIEDLDRVELYIPNLVDRARVAEILESYGIGNTDLLIERMSNSYFHIGAHRKNWITWSSRSMIRELSHLGLKAFDYRILLEDINEKIEEVNSKFKEWYKSR